MKRVKEQHFRRKEQYTQCLEENVILSPERRQKGLEQRE